MASPGFSLDIESPPFNRAMCTSFRLNDPDSLKLSMICAN